MFLFGARAAQDDESALHALGDFTANARLLLLSSVAILVGIISAYVAVALLSLINFFTNLFFSNASPSQPPHRRLKAWAASLSSFPSSVVSSSG